MSFILKARTIARELLPAGHIATVIPGPSGEVIVERFRGDAFLGQYLLSSSQSFGPYNLDTSLRLSALVTDGTYLDTETVVELATTGSVAAAASIAAAAVVFLGVFALKANLPDPTTIAAGAAFAFLTGVGLVYSDGTIWSTVTTTAT